MAQAAQLQQAPLCKTDILLFYGRKGKDTILPQQLMEQLEKAARVAGWDTLANPDHRKCDEFFLSL